MKKNEKKQTKKNGYLSTSFFRVTKGKQTSYYINSKSGSVIPSTNPKLSMLKVGRFIRKL